MPHDERTTSLWIEEGAPSPLPVLAENASADVCIVGAGMAGVTAAYVLASEGRSVLVLDRHGLAGGETARTTAHLTAVLDTRFHELERHHAPELVRAAAESHRRAIDRIERAVEEERIDCGFLREDGYLVGVGGEGKDEIERELEAARRAGFADAEIVATPAIPSFGEGYWLRFPRQAEFHPIRYLAGLARAAVRSGARFARAHVTEVEGGEPVVIQTETGARVTARAVLVVSGTPFTARVRVHTRQAAYRSYAMSFEIPPDAVPRCLVWDTRDPYHYVRLADHAAAPGAARAPLLVVGGGDHRTGKDVDPEERFARLEDWTRRRFPAGREVARWSGQVWEPVDGLAHIGADRSAGENVFLATGFAGNGMTYGTIAGLLLSDLACGRPNSWERVYDPARQLAPSLAEWLRENAGALPAYKEWLAAGDAKSSDHVPAGGSALLRRGLRMVAVHRDASGSLHKVSAVCPHLGAIVHWNEVEETWDCPAHGSRFDADGHVLTGPANRDLGTPEE